MAEATGLSECSVVGVKVGGLLACPAWGTVSPHRADMGEWPVREGDHSLNWAGELGVLWGGSPPCPPPSPPSSFPPVALVIPASCRGASVAHITALLPLVSAVELAHAGPW